jgi:putative addiction module component (TIGR02574 family)
LVDLSPVNQKHKAMKMSPTLAPKIPPIILVVVATITEVEKLALDLPESQRAVLAAHLLGSLPPVLHDEDEGIAEALRRDAELDANPSAGISLEQLDQEIERRRPS